MKSDTFQIPAIDLTVVIPTYNGGSGYLRRALEALKDQINTNDISWEVIVVNNNSNDNTAQLVKEYQEDWPKRYLLRYVFEEKQGLCFARQKGVEEARGQFVAFIDDDNTVARDWISEAHRFGQQHPRAGAWGGKIDGEFEIEAPEHFNRIACLLAIVDGGVNAYTYRPRKVLPPGAGLVVRRNAWSESVPRETVLKYTGVESRISLKSEDMEVLRYIQKSGWEVWHNPKMQMIHIMPKCRLEKEYLMRLCYSVGISRFPVRMLWYKRWQKPLALFAHTLNDLWKLVFHVIKYKNSIRVDTVVKCEFQLFLGSVAGPLYFLKKKSKTSIYHP